MSDGWSEASKLRNLKASLHDYISQNYQRKKGCIEAGKNKESLDKIVNNLFFIFEDLG
jgi:hypothetical protein